ncbi:hypothetical protein AB0C27_10215 [Nonomuraea sp. NPDC048882]|uniref:hypothetical protein n=1 Tax=Nonomuraea sp. NPDC048882 TaxID=3154347 RepID=UPI0033C6BBCB
MIRLGEQILEDLGEARTNNTLTRWLAHHTAGLIQTADRAKAAGDQDAAARASDARTAILQLWDHRSAWPSGWPPPRAAKVVELLDDLPDLDASPWQQGNILDQLQNLHHRILAALVDLIIAGEEDLEQSWLALFGDKLTPDEVAVLSRAATAEQRLSRLHVWTGQLARQSPAAPAKTTDADVSDADGAEPSPLHTLAILARHYRQIILNLLSRVGNDSTREGSSADSEPGAAPSEEATDVDAAKRETKPFRDERVHNSGQRDDH